MPTGYVMALDDDPKLTTAKWVTEGLSRAFGVCVTLRDHNMDLTEEQIEAHLEENIKRDAKYYVDALREANDAWAKFRENPAEFLKTSYDIYVKRTEKYNKKSVNNAAETKLRRDKVAQDLIKLRKMTTDDVTKNLAKFGLEQLERSKSDAEPHILEIKSYGIFAKDEVDKIKRDIDYYTKNLEETRQRARDRLQAYLTIKSEVQRVLENNTSEQTITKEEKP